MTTTDSHADTRLFDSLVARGDTSGLSHSDRLAYYMKLCADLGLNPAAQPFAYLKLNGKDVLYATRDTARVWRADATPRQLEGLVTRIRESIAVSPACADASGRTHWNWTKPRRP